MGSFEHATAPAVEQRLHSIENCRLVVYAPNSDAGERPRVDGALHGWLPARRYDGRKRDLDRKPRPATERRADGDLVIENPCDALDNRQAESQAARHLGSLVQPMKFLKNRLL